MKVGCEGRATYSISTVYGTFFVCYECAKGIDNERQPHMPGDVRLLGLGHPKVGTPCRCENLRHFPEEENV